MLVVPGCGSGTTSSFTFQGRSIVVKGGQKHDIDCQDDQCQIRIDDHVAVLSPGRLVIDGRETELPEFHAMTLILSGGKVAVAFSPGRRRALATATGSTHHSLPAGFIRVTKKGTGEALYVDVAGSSATQELGRASSRLSSYFDGPIHLLQGFRDREDTLAQAVFSARAQGEPMVGVIESLNGKRGGRVGVVFDQGDRIAASIQPLLAALAPIMEKPNDGRSPRKNVDWHTVPLPDGSGSIRMPGGWRVLSSHQGAVDLAGPHRERIALGLALPIATPQAAMNPLTGQPMPGTFAAYPSDPLTTLREVVPALSRYMAGRTGGPFIQRLRIVEAAPTVSPTRGRAAFVLWDAWMSDGSFRIFSLIDVSPVSAGWWQLYYTSLAAPSRQFASSLPTMIRIWQSGWHIDPRVFRQRLQRAYQSMRETNRLISDAAQYRNRVFEDARADWTEVFRGERMVLDAHTGEYHFTDIGWANQTVEHLNTRAGYERFVQIPLREFNR